MISYEIQSFGLDNLKQSERPDPSPGSGQLVVKVHAASLNYRDLLMAEGNYNPRMKLPVVPLSDGAGEVVEVGPGVTRFKTGDRVCGLFAQGWKCGPPGKEIIKNTLGGPLDGMLTEYALLSEDGVIKFPDHLSYEEAATLPCAALTAWSALVSFGNVKPGDSILILGTGGVSIFALQFGRFLGARTIITSSSDDKLNRAGEIGADDCINYEKTKNWERQVYKLTGSRGVDHVIEVGGAGTLEKSLRSVRPGGQISMIGILSGAEKEINLLPILMANICVQGIIVGHYVDFESMNRAVSQSELHPVIDRVFPFKDAVEAFRYLKSGSHFGKVCIKF